MFWTRLIVVACAGALGAGLANRGIALFHDGTRAILPELEGGRMSRREYLSLAFGSSFSLILGFGLPFSLVSSIVLAQALWLGTDVIGVWFPGPYDARHRDAGRGNAGQSNPSRERLGLTGAVLAGAVYGCLLVLGIEGLTRLAGMLPVNFLSPLAALSVPLLFTLAAIPALAVVYQHGLKKGILTFALTLLARQAAAALNLSGPDSWAFLAGMLVLVVYSVQEVRCEPPPESAFEVSREHVRRIRRRLPWIAVLGALYALASHLGIIMEGPQSALTWAYGEHLGAISYTVARALSFLPMRAMSILTTGAFTIDGLGFAPTAGMASPSPLLAALAGALVMCAEALGLSAIAGFFNRHPCLLKTANSLRTSMTKLLELASLVGGALAANVLSPGFGFLAAAGLYVINEAAGTPVVRAAIGPASVLLVGIMLNLLAIFHLQ